MRILIICSIFIVMTLSCKELGDQLNKGTYDKPVIRNLELSKYMVYPGDTVTATVTATNPEEDLLTYAWEAPDGGTFVPPLNDSTVNWIAPFEGKDYIIRAVVKNEKTATKETSVTVQSLNKPYVRITSPSNNQYFVQWQEITVDATVHHDNGINKVWLLVDNIKTDSLSGKSSTGYNFTYTADSSKSGTVELKVMAEVFNQPGNINSDYVNVHIEGILPKQGNP